MREVIKHRNHCSKFAPQATKSRQILTHRGGSGSQARPPRVAPPGRTSLAGPNPGTPLPHRSAQRPRSHPTHRLARPRNAQSLTARPGPHQSPPRRLLRWPVSRTRVTAPGLSASLGSWEGQRLAFSRAPVPCWEASERRPRGLGPHTPPKHWTPVFCSCRRAPSVCPVFLPPLPMCVQGFPPGLPPPREEWDQNRGSNRGPARFSWPGWPGGSVKEPLITLWCPGQGEESKPKGIHSSPFPHHHHSQLLIPSPQAHKLPDHSFQCFLLLT